MKMTGAYRPTNDTMALSDEVTVEGPDHAELVQQLRDRTPGGQVLLSVRVVEG
ncbi:hypothetical protein [Nocardioides sp. Leaf374]|uniref:hypothetical protein n=1 Tax=Nocardioides sp. Leaf374 TaxID=2876560 RepID=UPI001E46F4D8|nr:hypothetical protein [Nocardioides sp. Leaf374]